MYVFYKTNCTIVINENINTDKVNCDALYNKLCLWSHIVERNTRNTKVGTIVL